MRPAAPSPTVLVLRVWSEAPGDAGLRGRCLVTGQDGADPTSVGGEPTSFGTAAGKDALLELVDRWLTSLTEGAPPER